MTTNAAALPPLAKISMVGIWVETVLYGVNCVMYGLCMFVLLRGRKDAPVRWALVVMSTVPFLLCTIHVGASLQELLDVFVYAPAGFPDYSTVYWLGFIPSTPRTLKDFLYCTLVLTQQVILIWRLYVVFMHDWRVIILPILLCIGCVGLAYATSALPNEVARSFLLSAWALGFTLNVSVTLGIAGRLWWLGRRMASLTATSTNRLASSVYIAIESGAISAVVNVAVLALSENPAALTGLDIASQLLVLAPLLIVVQLGLTGRSHVSNGDSSNVVLVAKDRMVFRRGTPPEQDSHKDLLLHTASSHPEPPISPHDTHVE